MMTSVIAKWRLVGSLALLAFCTNATCGRELSRLGSTSLDVERELRESTEHNLNKIENTRCQNVGTSSSTANKQENAWRGLTPLHSMREEVERLLGPPKDSVGKTFIYETQAEKVHVWYSDGACKTSGVGQWNVRVGTILQIRVYPRAIILLRDLQLDTNKYQRFPDPHIPDWAFYKNEDEGVMVQISLENGCEQVEIVTYEPRKKDNHLRCSTKAKNNQ